MGVPVCDLNIDNWRKINSIKMTSGSMIKTNFILIVRHGSNPISHYSINIFVKLKLTRAKSETNIWHGFNNHWNGSGFIIVDYSPFHLIVFS